MSPRTVNPLALLQPRLLQNVEKDVQVIDLTSEIAENAEAVKRRKESGDAQTEACPKKQREPVKLERTRIEWNQAGWRGKHKWNR